MAIEGGMVEQGVANFVLNIGVTPFFHAREREREWGKAIGNKDSGSFKNIESPRRHKRVQKKKDWRNVDGLD